MLFKLLCNRYTDNGTLCNTCTLFIYQYAPIRAGQDQKFHTVFIKITPPQTF